MVSLFLPASSTKQFAWGKDPQRLHRSLRNGFGNNLQPVDRSKWRARSGLDSPDIELIPLNFFLYSKKGNKDDFVVCDTLVELALTQPFDLEFAKLSVFAFHLSNSGNWHGSELWPDGALAGWAKLFISELAWNGTDWDANAFDKQTLLIYISAHVVGETKTLIKIRNNYRFMLERAGILAGAKLEPMNYASRWALAAPQLFWDRKIFDGALTAASKQSDFESLFLEEKIYKLMRCSEVQGRATAKAAFREYTVTRLKSRIEQLDNLRPALASVA